jgi:hypothetical protein
VEVFEANFKSSGALFDCLIGWLYFNFFLLENEKFRESCRENIKNENVFK